MKRISKKSDLFLLALLLTAGCGVQGLSGPGKTTTLGYDLTLLKPRESKVPSKVPMHLVVAQAGALQPSPELLRALRLQTGLFEKVTPLPAAPEVRDFAKEVVQRDPNGLLKLAESMGADALLLIGGKLESESSRTAASVLDLSVVGNYVVPSNTIDLSGQVIGAFISVGERRLIFISDAAITRRKRSPSVSRHANEEKEVDKLRADLFTELGIKFTEEIALRSGKNITHERYPQLRVSPGTKTSLSPVATIFLLSDGFHISLAVPAGTDDSGQRKYVEVGLGERNWAMGRGWKWLDGMMAGIIHNEGIVVVEYLDNQELSTEIDKKKRVWKIDLNESEWGSMLETLEADLQFQEVLYSKGENYKVVKSAGGYHLFRTCHNFVLNPLGKTGKQLGAGFPTPTPILEKRLDRLFKANEKVR